MTRRLRIRYPRLKGYRTTISGPGLPKEVFLANAYVPGDAEFDAVDAYQAKHKLGMFGPPLSISVEETEIQRGAAIPGLIIEEIR